MPEHNIDLESLLNEEEIQESLQALAESAGCWIRLIPPGSGERWTFPPGHGAEQGTPPSTVNVGARLRAEITVGPANYEGPVDRVVAVTRSVLKRAHEMRSIGAALQRDYDRLRYLEDLILNATLRQDVTHLCHLFLTRLGQAFPILSALAAVVGPPGMRLHVYRWKKGQVKTVPLTEASERALWDLLKEACQQESLDLRWERAPQILQELLPASPSSRLITVPLSLAAPELGGVVVSTSPEFAQHLQWLMVYLPVVSSITALSAWQEVERAAARKAAHHAKNAVSNVRGLIARFGLAQEGGFTSHDLNYFRERLESIAQRLEAMHDDFTRGVTARPEATRMSLQNFLEGIQAEAREAFPDLTVTLRLPEKEVHVVASPIDMHHTFWELLTNAAHWTQGHGTVDISACLATEENSAASPWSVSPPVVRVDVQDDGPGIPLDRRGLIWVEGYTTRPEGKGRGLSFARDSVVRSGGSMWVDDPVDGKGTHFVLLLPQATLENSASQNQD